MASGSPSRRTSETISGTERRLFGAEFEIRVQFLELKREQWLKPAAGIEPATS
jgi:hypothetical protein